jgi:hypothetical protein
MPKRWLRYRLSGISFIVAGGVCVMAQTMDKADPDFVTALKTNISGIYFGQVARYRPDKIELEFRRAVKDPALVNDDEFMANLFYLVRMKEIRSLRGDVGQLVGSKRLKPEAQVSGLKTAFALGSPSDRQEVDRMESDALAELAQSGHSVEESPFVPVADRIGGTRTLVALRRLHSDSAARQAAATQQRPDNFSLIARLDKVRDRLERQVADLARKTEILSKPEPERTAGLVRLYMSRTAFLSCWAYRQLLGEASPASQAVARNVVAREIPTFLPSAGQSAEARSSAELDLRLVGVALVQRLGATLSADESELLRRNDSLIKERQPFFYPVCSWEDVLDVV